MTKRTRPRAKSSKTGDDDRDTPSFRLARSVLRLYSDPGGVKVSKLAEDLGLQPRAFRNYKHRIEHVLLEFLPHGSTLEYRGTGADRRLHVTTPVGTTAQWELVARFAAHDLIEQLFGFMGDAEIARQLDLAHTELLSRFERGLAASVRKNFSRMFYVVPDAPKDYSKPETVAALNEIIAAMTFNTRVKLTYTPPGKEPTEREVEPLTLGLHRSALYLFVRFKDNEKVYNFAIDRISKAERLKGQYFKYPTSNEWSPEHHFERTFGVFTPPSSKQEAIDVDLVFADVPWLKAHIRERRWMPNQRLEDLADGRLRLQFTVNSTIELKPWIAQWGRDVEVRAPK